MSTNHHAVWAPKYAWAEFSREAPPKRAASERVADFHEIYSLYDEDEVRRQASRCIQCPAPLCRTGCPLANRIPEWLGLAAEGRFLEAAELSRSTSNMPEICSRVCPQERLCEGACILNAKGAPVAALSIAAISSRLEPARRAKLVRSLRETASLIQHECQHLL